MIKLIKNNYKKFICILMGLIIMCCFTMANALNSNVSLSDMSTRAIDVSQLTYGEKINVLLDEFNDYETTNTETTISFQGEMYASIGEILGFDSLSNQEETVVKKFNTSYDYGTNSFYMNISYSSGDDLLETVSTSVEPQYDEERDDGYIEYEGERFYFSESFDSNGLNECIAGVDDAIVVGVGAVIVCGILITMAVTPPSVHQEIIKSLTYVTQTIVEAVKSFWGWFTKWVTKVFTRTTAVETTTVVEIKTPTLELDKEKIETKEMSKEDRLRLPKTSYYLAFADPSNNKMYISTVNISSTQAKAIMS